MSDTKDTLEKKTATKAKSAAAKKTATKTAAKKTAAKKATTKPSQDPATEAVKQTKDALDAAAEKANVVAEGVVETAEEKKDTIVDKAKKAIDDVPPADFSKTVDSATKAVKDTAGKVGAAVKGGFADHGIDTDKLGSALKDDAKNAATAVIGTGKFVANKLSSFMDNMQKRVDAHASEDEENKDDKE